MEDAKAINDRATGYFAASHEETTLEQLLDRVVQRAHEQKRFATRRDGILAGDDTTVEKTGKSTDDIAIVFDHCNDRYYLGFVIVSTAAPAAWSAASRSRVRAHSHAATRSS